MTRPSNPYLSRGPVRSPEMFFGRQETLREIADFLRGNQSVSLVGPRKIGKTSLLFQLIRLTVAQHLDIGANRLFCYLDCEGMGDDSPQDVLQQFAIELRSELQAHDRPEEPALEAACTSPSRLSFEGAARALGKQGLSIVIILDEFERLSANGKLDVNFFNALRSMASRFPLAFITASATPLIELTFSGRSQEILSSPFFNIFAQIYLLGLAEDEARALLWIPSEKAGRPFPASLQDSLFQFVGSHPFLIQVACFHAFDADAGAEEAERNAARELQSHFEYCWRNLDESQRSVLRAACAPQPGTAFSGSDRNCLRALEQKAILEQRGGTWTCPAGAWRRFVENQDALPVSEMPTASIASGGRIRYPSGNFGPYELLEPIGKGGMAEVYKARHTRLGRAAAIKILSPQLAADSDFRTRFEREARALASIKHPNIVQVFDFGDSDGLYYLVMEYIAGRDLGYRLGLNERLPMEHAWWIAVDVASALDFAHAQGIVHRDVKPSNVMLEPLIGEKNAGTSKGQTQRAILTDFGIVKLLDEGTKATRAGMYGTADYMAPEQISLSGKVDGRADIYALGVMLYRMLTGKLPFAGSSPNMVLMAHLETPPPDARELAPDLPAQAALALQRAMAKDPGERFATAKEFLAAMQ
jgi:tRNA A-37 threonylcarbamoyl transferase component Bud32